MPSLEVSYAVWKQLAQGNSWSTYHEVAGATRVYAWTGDRDHLYSTRVDAGDIVDWQTNFQTTSVQVSKGGDAVAQIIGLTGVVPAPVVEGVPVTLVQPQKVGWSWDKWAGGTQNVTTSWTSVYVLNNEGVLHGAFWQVNTRKMDLRILLDGIVAADLDMDELRQDFQFRSNGNDSGGGVCLGWLSEYSTNRWQFRPPEPARFDSSFEVRLKSHNGTKKCYRGLTVWRTL